MYTWGDNDEGQLGDGTTNAIQRPRLVAALQGKKINRVACGSAHTLAWSTSKPTNAGKLPAQVPHNQLKLHQLEKKRSSRSQYLPFLMCILCVGPYGV